MIILMLVNTINPLSFQQLLNTLMSLLDTPGFPGGSDGKESACNAGDLGSIPGSGRSPGEENGYPLNSMDTGAWWATVHGVSKGWTQLND